MRAVRNTAEGIEILELPEPEGDGVLVHVRSASICGTDLGFIQMGPLPFTLGHEFAGVLDDGTPVAVEPTVRCGACDQCLAGQWNRCRSMGDGATLGLFLDGGLADRVLVPEAGVVPLPEGLDLADACLVEPTAVAVHGVRLGAPARGERVAVVGGGSIGLLAVAALAAQGFDVALEARHPHQVAAGRELGASEPHGEYELVIDAAGSESGLDRAVELAAPGGRLVLLGVYMGTVPLPGVPMLVKELTAIASMGYCGHAHGTDVADAARLLAEEDRIAATVITHRLPLDRAADAFAIAADRASGVIKVALTP